MLVLPIGTGLASTRRATAAASVPAGRPASAGQAAVVGVPARSMLSLTANGSPASGAPGSTAAAAAATSYGGSRSVHAGWSPAARCAAVTAATGRRVPITRAVTVTFDTLAIRTGD